MDNSTDHVCCVLHIGQAAPGSSAAQVTLDVTETEEMTLEATVVAWHPLTMKLRLWHPRLAWIERLMGNKLYRNETDAYEWNAHEYLSLLDDLTKQALYGTIYHIQTLQKRISNALTAVFVLSTLLYVWLPLVGIATDAAGICLLFIWCRQLEIRKEQLFTFMDDQERNKQERRKKYCDAFRKAHSATSGGTGDV